MTRDTDLEIAYRQLQAYAYEPPGKSTLMDAVAAAWNRPGFCVVCRKPTLTGMNYCTHHFVEVERDQDEIMERAKELAAELNQSFYEGPDPSESQGFEEEA